MPNFTKPSHSAGRHRHRRLDFAGINAAALPHLLDLCRRWLPGGRLIGREWTCGSLAGEPGRSCRVNIGTGRWADFATNQRGGDPVSLYAAILRVSQAEAARRLAELLGMEAGRHA
jgi:putative DNA primase/helicase